MNAEDSPELLPIGWTVHTNVLKTGRKIEYYLNSETGQKFFSKDDLIHQARVQSLEFGHSQPQKRKFESDSENNLQIDIVRNSYEPPDWLPHAWIMEVKTRNSGGKKGTIYKCYVEVATGRKFYSKPEVFKYLGNVKRGSSKTKKGSISTQPSSKVGSPKLKEASITTQPSSKVCPSKPKEASISTQPSIKVGSSKPKEAPISRQPSSKVVFEKSTVEDLPPGWVKEVKVTKCAHRTRKDPYYTDPITGYVFRSRRGVERYLETGDISRHAFLPKKMLLIDQNMPSPGIERDVIIGIPVRGWFHSGEHSADGKVCSDVENNALSTPEASTKASEKILLAETVLPVALTAEISSQNHSRDHASDNGDKCEEVSDVTVLAQPVPARNLDRKADTDECSGLTYDSDKKREKDVLKDGKESGFQQKTPSSLSKSKTKKGMNLSRCTSKRLAGVEPNLVVDSVSRTIDPNMEADPVSSIIEHDATDNPAMACSNEGRVNVSADGHILKSEADTKQEKFIENKTIESKKVKANNSLSKATKRKMPNLPSRSSKRLAGHGPEPLLNSVSAGHVPQNATSSSRDQAAVSACPKLDDLPTEVCQQHETEAAEQGEKVSQQGQPSQTKQIHQQDVIKEQSERLDTDKVSEPKISPPFEEFLADPCLEFAYKTLTGEIPFENAAYSMLFENPDNIMNEKKSHVNGIEESSNRKTQTKSSKSKNGKESAPRRSSKQKAEFHINPMSNAISQETSVDVENVRFGKTKAVRRSGSARKKVTGVSKQVENVPASVHVYHGSPDTKISQEWRVNMSKQPLRYLNFSGNHSQKLELQPFFPSTGEQSQGPEPQSTFLAGDFWSDPCLEFAFKTLTGSLPVEDHLPAPGYFQQQVNSLQPQRESCFQQPVETYPIQRDGNLALPDAGFPSFSQTDISAHFDSLEKKLTPSCNLSVLPSGNVSMPSCGSIASQPPRMDGNKGVRGKVKF